MSRFNKKLVLDDTAFNPENLPRLVELLNEVVDTTSSHIPYERMLMRYFDSPSLRPVRVMDDKDIVPKNKATWVIYQVVPFVGRKNFHTYDRLADEEGNITKVNRVLKKKAPFGVYKLWLKAKELGYEDIIV